MPKADENAILLTALACALADPTPRPLLGTKAKPGIFVGGTPLIKSCAQRCVDQGWIEPTGGFEGQGRARKPLYHITAKGSAHVLEHGPVAETLREMLLALDGNTRRIERVQTETAAAADLTRAQTAAVRELLARTMHPAAPPSLPSATSDTAWATKALRYLAEHRQRQAYGRCTLAELYQHTAGSLSLGQFHDSVRQLAEQGKIGLHPFTGAAYQLQDEHYALVAGQEIKYYVDLVDA